MENNYNTSFVCKCAKCGTEKNYDQYKNYHPNGLKSNRMKSAFLDGFYFCYDAQYCYDCGPQQAN